MELTNEELKFLEILSDGRKKTYVHIVKGFGMPLTPMAPFTNKIAKRLLKFEKRGYSSTVIASRQKV